MHRERERSWRPPGRRWRSSPPSARASRRRNRRLPRLPDWARSQSILPRRRSLISSRRSPSSRLKGQFPPGTEPVLRDAHPKTHALVRAEFIVLDGLKDDVRYGVFKEPRRFDALIRFSAGGIEVQADSVPQANGMAIKLFGVEGEKTPGGREGRQDPGLRDDQQIPQLFRAEPGWTIRRARGAWHGGPNSRHRRILPEPSGRGESRHDDARKRAAVESIRGAILECRTRFKLGPHAIKFSAKPISVVPETPGTGPDFLREVARKQIAEGDVYFDFLIQVQTDPVTMPVEDSLVVWDEELAPFQACSSGPHSEAGHRYRLAIRRSPRPSRSILGTR